MGAVALPVPALAGAGGQPRFFEYLHVEANDGAAGGGHAAVRFGEVIYHFQYVGSGLIRSFEESSERFEYAYRAVGNRPIHVTSVPLSEGKYETLRDAFERRQLTQDAHFELLESARRDAALIGRLRELRCGVRDETSKHESSPGFRAAGYFVDSADARATDGTNEPASELRGSMAALRDAAARVYGLESLSHRRDALRGTIARLGFVPEPLPELVENRVPRKLPGLADRYTNELLAHLALAVLLEARPPVADALRTGQGAAFRLSDAEIEDLRARASDLRARLVRLLSSTREDWGYPMLVGMARLAALDSSVRTGRLFVVDTFSKASPEPAATRDVELDGALTDALIEERRIELEAQRAAFLGASASDEAAWSRFEVAVNLYLELENGAGKGAIVRPHPRSMVPSRSAELQEDWPLPAADCASLSDWWGRAQKRVGDAVKSLLSLYRYDVVSRNCVTEIFRVIDEADGAPSANASQNGVRERRGDRKGVFVARVDPARGMNFIPFVSAAAVNRTYGPSTRTVLPSYRRYWLARMRTTDGALRTWLRESNTITSTLSRPEPGADPFLFFTDGTPLMRPVYGVFNLGVAAGTGVAGMISLPFDHGRRLLSAARGVVFSLPELVFVNFRKGSNAVVPLDWTNPRVLARETPGAQSRRQIRLATAAL